MTASLRRYDRAGAEAVAVADASNNHVHNVTPTCATTNQGQLPASRVFVLLSTYNGASYLRTQLDSLLTQTHANWVLYWRDDGSTDATVAIMEDFATVVGADRCVRITQPSGRVRPSASFMAVLRAVTPLLRKTDAIAFADQDDFWLADKLDRGITSLTAADAETPALYCARLVVVDATLRKLGETAISPRMCGFPASLTQNIATGCTIMLNQPAARLVTCNLAPSASPHDWWCYLLVSAAGGQILVDSAAVALYRQHDRNVVGMPRSNARRAVAAVRRGPGVFMNVLRQHVAALAAHPELLGETARPAVIQLQHALQGGLRRKLAVLRLPGLRRQSWPETLLFRLWVIIG